MCGIVGLLIKKTAAREALGQLLVPMLGCMSERGPDSAGLAVFSGEEPGTMRRYNLFSDDPNVNWRLITDSFNLNVGQSGEVRAVGNHAIVRTVCEPGSFFAWVKEHQPHLYVLSVGTNIDMYKDVGAPIEIARRYHFDQLKGSHAVGHTRMATESAVSPAHAHPFTAGEDFCLVHNGSLSNPHSLRRMLERRGIRFQTDNDTEAACRFLEWRMREGDTLEKAIQEGFKELDGFYTLLMATKDKLVLVRDAFACKPAVVAETDDYVAVSSEFRSLAHLPGVDDAKLFEPEPERIYSWSV